MSWWLGGGGQGVRKDYSLVIKIQKTVSLIYCTCTTIKTQITVYMLTSIWDDKVSYKIS